MSKIQVKTCSKNFMAFMYDNASWFNKQIFENPNDNSWIYDKYNEEPFVLRKYYVEDFSLTKWKAKTMFKSERQYKNENNLVDQENFIALYENLNSLPNYMLTSENFWLWLIFDKFYAEAVSMIPFKDEKSVFKNMWLFSQGKRRGLNFGVLSRGYFWVKNTVDENEDDKYVYTRFALENRERIRNWTWRTYSDIENLIRGCVKAEYDVFKDKNLSTADESKDLYDKLAKELSKFGGREVLATMKEEDFYNFVYQKYCELLDRK